MRLNRWVCAAGSLVMVGAGVLVEQACSTGNVCTTADGVTTCELYTEPAVDAGSATVKTSGGELDAGHPVDAPIGEGGPPNDAPPAAFGPGNGMPCTGPVGGAADAACDPSDESAPGCLPYTPPGVDAGCTYSPKCGNTATCEPFVKNPEPGKGVDNYRMRLINLTAPTALTSPVIQSAVVTKGVDLPGSVDAGGAPCGEDGDGLFNWILSVDKANQKVLTGGAPISADPFGLGYCFIHGTVAGHPVAPVEFPATFTGNTFSTAAYPGTLNIPIFLQGSTATTVTGVVILPISAISMNDVTISEDGDCIGSVNNSGNVVGSDGVCSNPAPSGASSCSRWHSAGTFSGYMTLAAADAVPISILGGKSLCSLLTSGMGLNCTAAELMSGDYCAGSNGTLGHPCTNGDSVWLSAQFAASAVNVQADGGVSLCSGGSIGGG